ncbi:antiterminator Q family protein [Leclercia adecarboxylata]|uniref:antiterminator Q family protein n=1 Tax=Leclercia adecarboxylata TaxID=83655 RepID=UPI003D2AE5FE
MQDIDHDLRRWAAWTRGALNLGIKPLTMYDDGTRDKVAYMPMSDDEGLAFDPAVATLKQIDKEQYNIVRLHYIYGMSARAIAKTLGRGQTPVLTDLHLAQTFVAGFVYGKVFTEAKIALTNGAHGL